MSPLLSEQGKGMAMLNAAEENVQPGIHVRAMCLLCEVRLSEAVLFSLPIPRSSRRRWVESSLSTTPPSGRAERSKKKPCFRMTLKSWTIYWEKSGINGTRCAANLWKGKSSPGVVPAGLVCQGLAKRGAAEGRLDREHVVILWGGGRRVEKFTGQ